MIKNNVKIKKQLTIADKINATNDLVEGYFYGGNYTPYLREINDIVMFFTYCVEGLTFEKTTDEEGNENYESVYACVTADPELMKLYKAVNSTRPGHETLSAQLAEIDEHVKDIVDFEKQKLIHSSIQIPEILESKLVEILEKDSKNKDIEAKVLKIAEDTANEQKKQAEYTNQVSEYLTPEELAKLSKQLSEENIKLDDFAQIVTDKYISSESRANREKSLIDEKNNKIKELEKYKAMYDVRNVMVDRK